MNLQIRQNFSRNALWILLIIITAAIGFWPVISGIHPLKWDAIDYYFPSRHLLSQFIANGEWPLWVPYQNLGYPFYADPQSGVWYPISLFLAAISSYPLAMIHAEFFIHVVIAGIGMFYLIRNVLIRHEVAFMASVAYMLCGFFVSNAQHLTWIISAAWLPVVINTFLLLLKHPRFIQTIPFVLALFMMFSGGYPAFVFILIYLLLILWMVYIVMYVRKKKMQVIRRLVIFSFLSLLLFIILSAFIFLSEYQVLSWMSRGNGIELQAALFGPFSPDVFISFLLPYAVADMKEMGTDISMANGFLGLLPLLFMLSGILIRKSWEVAILFWFGVVCLLASVGDTLLIREFLYNYFPLMDMFRFPAAFRLFFIFGALVLAAFAANHYIFQKKLFSTGFKILISVTLLSFILWIVILRSNAYLGLREFISTDLFHFSPESHGAQHRAIDLLFSVFVLFFAILLIFRNSKVISVFRFMLIITSLQMIFSVWTNAPYTIVSEDVKFEEANSFVKQFPVPFPSMQMIAVGQNERNAPSQIPFWKNLNLFNRQISAEGFTPFKAQGFEWMQESVPQVLSQITKNPAAYCSQHWIAPNFLKNDTASIDSSVVINEASVGIYPFKKDEKKLEYSILCTLFQPQNMTFIVESNKECFFVLQQNRHDGWSAQIDGRPAKICPVNYTEMAVMIPSGKSEVSFVFRPKNIVLVWSFSAASFVVLLGIWLTSCLFFRKK